VGHVLSLDVPKESEVLTGPVDRDNIHEAERVLSVSPDLSVDLDKAFFVLADLDNLLVGEGVLQSLSQKNSNWNALSQFVGSTLGSGGISSRKFVEHPVGGSRHSLQVFLWSSCLYKLGEPLNLPFYPLLEDIY
jgi:hypothetical protein